MLVRIVKMTFQQEKTEDFMTVFKERKALIASFEGCRGVDLLRDVSNPSVFFTYSRWVDETSLDRYRQSELFNEVWGNVKQWFAEKPEAWSVIEVNS